MSVLLSVMRNLSVLYSVLYNVLLYVMSRRSSVLYSVLYSVLLIDVMRWRSGRMRWRSGRSVGHVLGMHTVGYCSPRLETMSLSSNKRNVMKDLMLLTSRK